ncbi:hypothetical protein COO60DRAFT_99780 [Scenedesmus sp. NREL 46B-D3]|nr:hypothetical protein COO60DRAFT_99780 [Scenedesmus sp. NREL 46B-D3]
MREYWRVQVVQALRSRIVGDTFLQRGAADRAYGELSCCTCGQLTLDAGMYDYCWLASRSSERDISAFGLLVKRLGPMISSSSAWCALSNVAGLSALPPFKQPYRRKHGRTSDNKSGLLLTVLVKCKLVKASHACALPPTEPCQLRVAPSRTRCSSSTLHTPTLVTTQAQKLTAASITAQTRPQGRSPKLHYLRSCSASVLRILRSLFFRQKLPMSAHPAKQVLLPPCGPCAQAPATLVCTATNSIARASSPVLQTDA